MFLRVSVLAVICGMVTYLAGMDTEVGARVSSYSSTSVKTTILHADFQEVSSDKNLYTDSHQEIDLMMENTESGNERKMSESLEQLHLSDFNDYLNGEPASETNILAFYTDSRWYDFYRSQQYQPEDIEQLIVMRNMYLSDVSQSGKKYYYQRWSIPPHEILANKIARCILESMNGHDFIEREYDYCVAEISSESGVSKQFAHQISRSFLLDSINRITTASKIFISTSDVKVGDVSVNSDFIDFLND